MAPVKGLTPTGRLASRCLRASRSAERPIGNVGVCFISSRQTRCGGIRQASSPMPGPAPAPRCFGSSPMNSILSWNAASWPTASCACAAGSALASGQSILKAGEGSRMLVSAQLHGGHVDTSDAIHLPGRRARRRHTASFKAQIVSAYRQPGVSLSAVTLTNGLNPNMVRRRMLPLT